MEMDSGELTIDQLSAATGASSRTIRYYQAKHLLPQPKRRGRVAYYDERHRERLALIDELQSRGLTLRAIKDLVRHAGEDNAPMETWLGLDRLRGSWANNAARSVTREPLEELTGGAGPNAILRLLEAGVIHRENGPGAARYQVDTPSLLVQALALEEAGIDLDVSSELYRILERNFRTAAREAIEWLDSRSGCGFGRSDSNEDHAQAIGAVFPEGGSPLVRTIFAHAVEQEMAEWLEKRGPKQIGRRPRAKRRKKKRT